MRIIKWIILFIVSVGIGSFIDINILEKMDIDAWLSRSIGCLITVFIALIMYRIFLEKTSNIV
jgi:hypothetical protein